MFPSCTVLVDECRGFARLIRLFQIIDPLADIHVSLRLVRLGIRKASRPPADANIERQKKSCSGKSLVITSRQLRLGTAQTFARP